MGFSRQEYWSGLPFPSSGDLSDPGIEPWSPALQADSLAVEPKSTGLHRIIVLEISAQYLVQGDAPHSCHLHFQI